MYKMCHGHYYFQYTLTILNPALVTGLQAIKTGAMQVYLNKKFSKTHLITIEHSKLNLL